MHLEHGGALPRDLQGDPVEYYYSVRDGISTPKSTTKKLSIKDKSKCSSNGKSSNCKSMDETENSMISLPMNKCEIDSKHCDKLESNIIVEQSHDIVSAVNLTEREKDKSSLSESVDQSLDSSTPILNMKYPIEIHQYSKDTKFECARLNLFPDIDFDHSKRCANNFSQIDDTKRYANEFHDVDLLKNSKSCDNSRDVPMENYSLDVTIELTSECDAVQDTGPNSVECGNSTKNMSVIQSPESLITNAISMESLNDYFDSMEKFENELDSCNVDIVVTDDKKYNQSDKLSSQIAELEDKFATCSPLNSSASSSSSSYYSLSSSPSASMTFQSASSTNELSDNKHDKT